MTKRQKLEQQLKDCENAIKFLEKQAEQLRKEIFLNGVELPFIKRAK